MIWMVFYDWDACGVLMLKSKAFVFIGMPSCTIMLHLISQ